MKTKQAACVLCGGDGFVSAATARQYGRPAPDTTCPECKGRTEEEAEIGKGDTVRLIGGSISGIVEDTARWLVSGKLSMVYVRKHKKDGTPGNRYRWYAVEDVQKIS